MTFDPTLIYSELCGEMLIDPLTLTPLPVRTDWFSDVTDVNATQLMPAVTPSPKSRHAA